MNILVLNYEYPPLGGGAAPVCRALAEGMAVKGHKLTVVTMGFPGLPSHEVHDGLEIFRLQCLRRREHVCMPWEQYSYILAAKDFLRKHLRTHTYDVCHTHFVIPTGPVAKWVRQNYGIPYVLTAHGSDVEGHNQKKYMKVMHRLLRPAWKGIVREAYAAAAPSVYLIGLMNKEMRSGKYLFIPNGVESAKFRTEKQRKEKCILLMGRMQPGKNFQTVFRALAMLPETVREGWRVEILGDGPLMGELRELCTQLDLDSQVSFRGWVENGSEDQISCLKRAAVYISASRFENCPVAVLEAIAAGCYPLLSDIAGHRQFFSGDEDRVFFPADDAAALSGKLQAVMREELWKAEGVPVKTALFDLEQITEKYVRLLAQAAGVLSL